ncbi:MAG: hypothetical protein AAF990_10220 [Bacteroidota bacterium]
MSLSVKSPLWVLLLLCLITFSCKGEEQTAKKKFIPSASKLELETDAEETTSMHSTEKEQAAEQVLVESEAKRLQSKAPKGSDPDDIQGVWEVKNNYYMAVYEIEKYKGKYVGKIHYYNDGKTEYTGTGNEEDYFIEGITFEDGMYKNGKMHLPDGSFYYVVFTLDGDELTVVMSLKEQPYKEVWKRKKV